MRSITLAAICLVTACSAEPVIATNTCGNDVVEPANHEDCDRPGATCTSACRIACVAMPACVGRDTLAACPFPRLASTTVACASPDALDGTCCPAGMACGVDGTCHQPTGRFRADVGVPFDTGNIALDDVDGDLVADVLGAGNFSAAVGYGAATSPLATQVHVPAPAGATSTRFGDFDGDGIVDIMIPTGRGLSALSDAGGVPAPLAFPIDTSADVGIQVGVHHERLAAVAGTGYPMLVALDHVASPLAGDGKLQLAVIAPPAPADQNYAYAPVLPRQTKIGCGNKIDSLTLRGRAIHPFRDGAVVRVPIATGATKLCVATANPITGDAGYPVTLAVNYPYKLSGASVGEMFFANITSPAGACPDLIVPVYDVNKAGYTALLQGAAGASGCTVPTTIDAATPILVGAPLAAIGLATSTPARGLVTSAGIYAWTGGPWTIATRPVSPPTRAWQYAVVADLDRDGRDDLVTVGLGNDVEVIHQLASLAVPRWSDDLIVTDETVRTIAVGNFDGDTVADIAFATIDPSNPPPVGDTTLSIAWGGSGYTTADIGTFANASDLTAIDLYDPALPPSYDASTDLVVARGGPIEASDGTQQPGSTVEGLLIAEYGSTSRALQAPFNYVTRFDAPGDPVSLPQPAEGRRAIAGRFDASGKPGLLGVFTPVTGTASSPTPSTTSQNVAILALSYDATSNGFSAATAPFIAGCLPDPSGSIANAFCLADASYTSLLRSGRDVLLGFLIGTPGASVPCYLAYDPGTASGPTLAAISCADAAPAAASSSDPETAAAFAALSQINRFQIVDTDGTNAHVLIATPPGAAGLAGTAQAFLWELTLDASNRPQLANPIAIDPEVDASGALAGAATCYAGVRVELGEVTAPDGAIAGADQRELVVQCTIGVPQQTVVLGRYARSDGGPAVYRQIGPMLPGGALNTLAANDIDGDGLADLVIPTGREGTGSSMLRVLVQCDAHDPACEVAP